MTKHALPIMRPALREPNRRRLLQGMGVFAIALLPADMAQATPETMRAAIARVTGGILPVPGRVIIELPPLVENGNTVPLGVRVDSPMTAANHIRAIHVFNEKNPQPHVISVRLGPQAGRAQVATRIKLADSQRVVALAETSSGAFWSASADVIVTLAACIEELP